MRVYEIILYFRVAISAPSLKALGESDFLGEQTPMVSSQYSVPTWVWGQRERRRSGRRPQRPAVQTRSSRTPGCTRTSSQTKVGRNIQNICSKQSAGYSGLGKGLTVHYIRQRDNPWRYICNISNYNYNYPQSPWLVSPVCFKAKHYCRRHGMEKHHQIIIISMRFSSSYNYFTQVYWIEFGFCFGCQSKNKMCGYRLQAQAFYPDMIELELRWG